VAGSANRVVAIVVGILFVLLGVVGFFVTAPAGFVDTTGVLLLGVFSLNGLHNVVHILIGAALVIAALAGARPAKTTNQVIGTACLVLGLAGLFVVGSPFNVLAINGADNVVHFGSAAVLLTVGLGAERPSRAGAAERG